MFDWLEKLKDDDEGFTLVELMIVVAIIGILAAIAIPSFMKYLKRSKTTEASTIVKKMTSGAKTYFTTEQSKCGGVSGCDQPWHDGGTAGMPVSFPNYVFPGGTGATLTSTGSAPSNGAKYVPTTDTFGGTHKVATKNKLNFSLGDPLYFQYMYTTGGSAGPDATATSKAIANFDGETGANHTVTQKISASSDQTVKIIPMYTTNEFK